MKETEVLSNLKILSSLKTEIFKWSSVVKAGTYYTWLGAGAFWGSLLWPSVIFFLHCFMATCHFFKLFLNWTYIVSHQLIIYIMYLHSWCSAYYTGHPPTPNKVGAPEGLVSTAFFFFFFGFCTFYFFPAQVILSIIKYNNQQGQCLLPQTFQLHCGGGAHAYWVRGDRSANFSSAYFFKL